MELATMPHHSSGLSTTAAATAGDGAGSAPAPTTSSATGAAAGEIGVGGVSRDDHQQRGRHLLQSGDGSGGGGTAGSSATRGQRPPKSASDSRVAALATQPNVQHGADDEEGHGDEYEALKYGASHVIHLFVPVSLCMAVVILTVMSVGFYSEKDGNYLPYTPFHSDTDDTGTLLAQSIGNALVMLVFVICATVVLVLLYYYRFYKVIHGWLVVSTIGLLTMFSFTFVLEVFKNYNIPLDYPSLAIFLWNWCMVGMVCIHWKGPLLLQQFYLIFVSALMALLFIKYLPDWSVWTVLTMLSIWDLVAVLCPKGPLRVLVETTQERNEPILPALIYSSTILYSYVIYGAVSAAAVIVGGATANGDGADQQHQPAGTAATVDAAAVHPQQQDNTNDAAAEPQPGVESTSSSTDALLVQHQQRRGRSAGTSDDSANTVLTTVLTTDGVTESHAHTVSSSSAASSACKRSGTRATPRSRSPRHPASERAIPVSMEDTRNAAGEGIAEERGVKLGLGDFIFYSVLVGKASSYGDWNVTIACYVAILVGLAFTLMLLALFRKALPALPISIFTGIIFFFATRWLISPFLDQVSGRQILL